ncbi:hypothetical protein OTK01_000331 [Caldicellulosiruptor acetigenus]|uniref:Uncharacterized protein n=1 Tax=Caldicellulosiruptor owensensis TaxID=55205 RepID=A0A7C5Z788_9FIRM|nr:hypothetical protein [Caldicellulosiruptor acetigenus]WAM36557.1 hypothetical protein OTK01_000331 [Caldicellulosiruptor acetigenus]
MEEKSPYVPTRVIIDGIKCKIEWKDHALSRCARRKVPEYKIKQLLEISPEILDYPTETEIIIQAKWFAPVIIVKCNGTDIEIHIKTVIDKSNVTPKKETDIIIDKRFFE